MRTFKAELHRPEGKGTWTYVTVPFNVETVFGTRGRVAVSGKIDEQTFRGTLLPHGDGRHILVVNKELRDKIEKHSGASVKIQIDLDTAPRVVELPDELTKVLKTNPAAGNLFKKLSSSRQKGFAEWIQSAKKQPTREQRAAKAVDMILTGSRLKT